MTFSLWRTASARKPCVAERMQWSRSQPDWRSSICRTLLMNNRTPPEDQQIIPFDSATPEVWQRGPVNYPFAHPGEHDGSGSLASYWQGLLGPRSTVLGVMVVVTEVWARFTFKNQAGYKSNERLYV